MPDYDLVVVGGGPAGSTLAALVAMRGHRVLLLEKEHFPRYQIGESLLPATVHGICRLLGVTDALQARDFTVKRGGTFRWGSNPVPWSFQFGDLPAFAGDKAYAYQVERMRFDEVLLDNARRVGVEVREGCSAADVVEGDGRVEGLTYVDEEHGPRTVTARYVADASGHQSRIYRHMTGVRHYSDFFRNVALFAYFENGKRLPEPNSGNVLSAAFDDGWFWYIPLTKTLTSVGAVVRRELAHVVQGDPEQALGKLIEACPLISEYLEGATRVTEGPYGKIRIRRDYSHCHEHFYRPGMLLVGDTACFVDPVLSSGVHLATYGALLAARAVNSCLAGALDEERAFGEFARGYRAEYTYFYKFLRSFYAQNVNERSYFWEAKRLTGSALSDIVAFVELVGGAASGEPALIAEAGLVMSYAARASQSQAAATSDLVASPDGLAWDLTPTRS
ncbi:tryptophan 7-halogenase [Streptosporangiaceae bacterium NEAU-GS5]|nr:tryptophan 7-halogenase [Streptosporangiaceae bacterium NEAU-GS5]